MFSSLSSVESVSTAIGVTLLSIYCLFLRETRKLPPKTKHNVFEVLYNLSGTDSPDFLLQCMKDNGPVFRVSYPDPSHLIYVCDPTLARKIYEEEDEKPTV
jgi:hypothetical protein